MKDEEMFVVDIFVCGVYRGQRKVGKNSLVGALLSGNDEGARCDEDLSTAEAKARLKLVEVCRNIVAEFEFAYSDDEESIDEDE